MLAVVRSVYDFSPSTCPRRVVPSQRKIMPEVRQILPRPNYGRLTPGPSHTTMKQGIDGRQQSSSRVTASWTCDRGDVGSDPRNTRQGVCRMCVFSRRVCLDLCHWIPWWLASLLPLHVYLIRCCRRAVFGSCLADAQIWIKDEGFLGPVDTTCNSVVSSLPVCRRRGASGDTHR